MAMEHELHQAARNGDYKTVHAIMNNDAQRAEIIAEYPQDLLNAYEVSRTQTKREHKTLDNNECGNAIIAHEDALEAIARTSARTNPIYMAKLIEEAAMEGYGELLSALVKSRTAFDVALNTQGGRKKIAAALMHILEDEKPGHEACATMLVNALQDGRPMALKQVKTELAEMPRSHMALQALDGGLREELLPPSRPADGVGHAEVPEVEKKVG